MQSSNSSPGPDGGSHPMSFAARCAVALIWPVASVFFAMGAFAHSDEYFDSRPSAHGGQVRMAGPLHLELLRTEDEIIVFVTDHLETPLPTAEGRARLRIPGREDALDLQPAGANRFAVSAAPPPRAELVLFVELKGLPAQSARFGGDPPSGAAPKGGHHAGH